MEIEVEVEVYLPLPGVIWAHSFYFLAEIPYIVSLIHLLLL